MSGRLPGRWDTPLGRSAAEVLSGGAKLRAPSRVPGRSGAGGPKVGLGGGLPGGGRPGPGLQGEPGVDAAAVLCAAR